MLDLLEMEQLIAFADCGTLSKASEQLHISQPTLTRTMKHVEEAFAVPLFVRGKNKIALNETGMQAVEYARKLLTDAENAVSQVQAFHARMHTIVVESCAPAPLWFLLPRLSSDFPAQTISSRLAEISEITEDVASGRSEIGIMPYAVSAEGIEGIPIIREELSVCIPKEHHLADRQSLSFAELNGFNCLLASEIGFWNEMCRRKMPASRFLIQNDEFALRELIRESTLPCFTTNLVEPDAEHLRGRRIIPVTDPEANVTYYMIYQSGKKGYRETAKQLAARNKI